MISYIRMERLKRLFRICFVFLFFVITVFCAGIVHAAENSTGEVVRQSTIVVTYTRYEWWLLSWSDNQIICQVFIDHEGWPTVDEVLTDCGGTIYRQWLATQPCTGTDPGNLIPSDCTGLYLYFVGSAPTQQEIKVDLPPAQVYLTLSGCNPIPPENLCPTIPKLHFNGDEPLPNEQIATIHVKMDGNETTCPGSSCDIQLSPTDMSGTTIEFWADSSFGDSTDKFTAMVRVVDSGVSATPTSGGWYIDVISTQWQGNEIATCAQVWQSFPPVGGVPDWLSTPEDPAFLTTEEPYSYLAGRLIANGVVDASSCSSGGLQSNGYADNCGLEVAMPEVIVWQNQFDDQILQVANGTKVPAQLLKNLFAQESQFWPGVFRTANEYGLGQITDNGADAILLWNPSFYNQFCTLVLSEDQCAVGYVKLSSEDQAILRGALATSSNADCVNCEYGIDLTTIDASINLVADTLLANCEQVAQIVYNATGRIAGGVSSYEELWKFTIANYHVGSGCLSYPIYTAWAARSTIDWEHISTYLTDACETVIPYVTEITTSP